MKNSKGRRLGGLKAGVVPAGSSLISNDTVALVVVPVYEFSSPLLILRVMPTLKGVNDAADEVNVTLKPSPAIEDVTRCVHGMKYI